MSSEPSSIAEGCYIVRIHGLASAVGQKLNGHLGKVKSGFSDYPDDSCERIPVWIDGQPEPIALQRKNIQSLFTTERKYHEPFAFVDIGTGVGRSNILSNTFQAVTHVKPSPAILTKKILDESEEKAPRFRGLLHVIAKALKEYDKTTKPIVIQCTDLNLAQAINIEAAKANNTSRGQAAAVGGSNHFISIDDDSADRKWGPDWIELKKHLNGKNVKQRIVMAQYSPHRLQPPLFSSKNDKSGVNRIRAVEHGSFYIYPCHHEQFRDALEVRYGIPGKSLNESWLDYGQKEMIQYVVNAILLHQADKRLQPKILAQVDPQAFWSAIFHHEVMIAALSTHLRPDHEIVKQWKALSSGISKSRKTIEELEEVMEIKLLPDRFGNWYNIITNEEQLHRVSLRNLHAALIAISWHCLPGTVDYCQMYKGTRIEKDVAAMLRAFKRGQDNDEVDDEQYRFMCVLAFDELLSETSSTTTSNTNCCNSLEVCASCGKTTGTLLLCARCECVSFCNERCQKAIYKQHKTTCRKISNAADNLEKALGPRINFRRIVG